MFAMTRPDWTPTTFPLFFKTKKKAALQRDELAYSSLAYRPAEQVTLSSAFTMSSTVRTYRENTELSEFI